MGIHTDLQEINSDKIKNVIEIIGVMSLTLMLCTSIRLD